MSKRSNEEWYRRSFDRLHLSDDFGKRLEERLKENGKESKMNTSIHGISRFAAAAIAGVIAFGSFGACYAADLGGIRTRIEIWMNGEKSEVEVEEDGMGYSWTDADGETYGFGGIALDEDGNGDLWLGTWNLGVYRIDVASKTVLPAAAPGPGHTGR